MTNTRQSETVIKYSPETNAVWIDETDCNRSCDIKDNAPERVKTVLDNPDFKANSNFTQVIQTCILDSRCRCILTLSKENEN